MLRNGNIKFAADSPDKDYIKIGDFQIFKAVPIPVDHASLLDTLPFSLLDICHRVHRSGLALAYMLTQLKPNTQNTVLITGGGNPERSYFSS